MEDYPTNLTSTAPGFIKKYFSTSRLHHLSTWKADLCEYVKERTTRKAVHSRCSIIGDRYRTILHIDMDCFFASVGIRDKPELKDKPVAVAHSVGGVSLDYSSSEIASCNYIARSKGVKNGTYIGSAKVLAPDLIIVPYDFDKYDEVSKLLYNILISHADFVQAVSCDEAFIDVTFQIQRQIAAITGEGLQFTTNEVEQLRETLCFELANKLREEIYSATGCCASVGVSHNILLARLATQRAKPDGLFFISHLTSEGPKSSPVQALLRLFPIGGLPGVGHSMVHRCAALQLQTCGDLSGTSLSLLQREFGAKTGLMLHNFAAGIDDRVLENKPRQTVGCEINWGIRFIDQSQVDSFLQELCSEVFERLLKTGMTSAGHVTVTAKKKLYEGEPGKFLGCGHCDDLARSSSPSRAISSCEALTTAVLALYRETGVSPTDVRGIGIHLKTLRGGEGSVVSCGPQLLSAPHKVTDDWAVASSRHRSDFAVRAYEEEEDEQEDVEQRALGTTNRHWSGSDAARTQRKQSTISFQRATSSSSAATGTSGKRNEQSSSAQGSVKNFFLPVNKKQKM